MKNLFAIAASALVLGLTAPAMAQSNNSTVNQWGGSQTATIDQLGNLANNNSTVLQGWYSGGGSNGNKAEITQAGSAAIENYSTAIQDGQNNKTVINQNGNGAGGDYNNSYSKQLGDGNKIDVLQGDLATNNNSWIEQNGNNNKSTVKQGGGEGGNLVNSSTIYQQGTENQATVEQGGINTVANASAVNQYGNGNVSTVNQH